MTSAPPDPTTTTTTTPPGLDTQALRSGFAPGLMATYDGSLETRVGWTGEAGAELFGSPGATEGGSVGEVTGRQRLLALDADGAIELVEDFTAEAGSFTVDTDGEPVTTKLTRDELLDLKPVSPPIVISESSTPSTSFGSTGAPQAMAQSVDWLTAAAVVGPPLTADRVNVGDSWTVAHQDPLVGTVSIRTEIVAEVASDGGELLFEIEFSGSATELPVGLDLAAALEFTGVGGASRGFDASFPLGTSVSVSLRAATVDGSVRYDPSLGVPVDIETLQTFAMTFTVGSADAREEFTLDIATYRSLTLIDLAEAASFEVESVLDRFEADPFDLAVATFVGLTRYEILDVTDEQADVVFDALSDLRSDLFAAAGFMRFRHASREEATAFALTAGGEFRGAPFLADEVALFVSGTSPRSVSIGDRTAFRVTVDDVEWLLYSNETHLFIVVGPRDVSREIMTDLADSADPYLWQPGDCLIFDDGFDDATPYAPFGLHGLRHCAVGHTYEVIHSEVLPEPAGARFPSDLSDRSEAACGQAFFELSGTTELESALGLIRYLPDENEWANGSRYFACVVFVNGSRGKVSVAGRIDGENESLRFVLEEGTCLFSLFPVDCDDPHNGEIIAVFELAEEPGAPMPDSGDLADLIADGCSTAFTAFELGDGPGVVDLFEISDIFGAWSFGARRYYCMASTFGFNGLRLDITGTFGGGWQEAQDRVSA